MITTGGDGENDYAVEFEKLIESRGYKISKDYSRIIGQIRPDPNTQIKR